ncbi:hypothetical protein ASG92_12880 [Arthrobacter sp. Soil736]|uniref:hypothetical protein n=1 Tax=Arthrobacter sp. Soil736 TaxID=1736395 RepID=UPI0006FC9F9B|nr:hypothetical protein [Arthrobacter sp. Soil736]KRE44556.1 hypothetical protein ASG92_12880 [Arthrobacter sp. Soil736]
MKLTEKTSRPEEGGKKIVSRMDATLLMIATALAAVLTTSLSVAGIAGYFTGPVTLELPIASTNQAASGLRLGSNGHYTALSATIPSLPSELADLLAWSAALSQLGVLAIQALVFLLAFRLRSAVLFTAKSVWIIGACGAILALVGTVGQVLNGWALTRVADMVAGSGRNPGESVILEAEFNAAPLMLGIVLVLVAAVFQYGRRLQRDTEGLV